MAWAAGADDKYQWWQVDLGKTTKITMVATQGGIDVEWVTSYFIAYSQDGQEFQTVAENNKTKVRCQCRLSGLLD